MKLDACMLCGTRPIPRPRGGLTLLECKTCGLVSLDRKGDAGYFSEVEASFFGSGYLRRTDPLGNLIRRAKARRRLRVIRRFHSDGSLLDIGTGTGELLGEALRMGYRAEGLEFSEPLASRSRVETGAVVHHGDIVGLSTPAKFDVAVMSHVLEHTPDPAAALRSAAKLLRPRGILYVAVPNIASWEAALPGWGSYEPYHFWYFTPSTLARVLSAAGFDLLMQHTWEPASAWFNTVLRTAMRQSHAAARNAVHRDDGAVLRPAVVVGMTALNVARLGIGAATFPLRWIQERLLRGEELVMIASKRSAAA